MYKNIIGLFSFPFITEMYEMEEWGKELHTAE